MWWLGRQQLGGDGWEMKLNPWPAPPCSYHELAGLLAVHETFRDGVGCQDLIPEWKGGHSEFKDDTAPSPALQIHPSTAWSEPGQDIGVYRSVGAGGQDTGVYASV